MARAPARTDWLEVSVAAPREHAERLEQRLLTAGALAVTLQDAEDAPVLEPAPGETPLWPRVRLTGLFAGTEDPLQLLAELHLSERGAEWHIASLADRPWEREWLRDFKPLRFGRRLAVVPTGLAAPADAVVLRLDPGLAFGTGTHPTTALCLEWLDALAEPAGDEAPPLSGALVIDYGCGSGILAMAALRLGAAAAIAVDLDPQALLATRANADINKLGEHITVCRPEQLAAVLGPAKADILVANILAGPLLELLPLFAAYLREGGRMALSGILEGQARALSTAAETWFRLDAPAVRGDWVKLSGQRKMTS